MAEVTETQLPGVGIRYDFVTVDGEMVSVLCHRGGRREILVYDKTDPDAARTALHMSSDDARTLSELLGATQVTEAVAAVQQQIEGLAIEWVTVPPDSPFAGMTVGDGQFRTRTGASLVAILRDDTTIPAPGADFELHGDDVVVAVGTADGLGQLRELLLG